MKNLFLGFLLWSGAIGGAAALEMNSGGMVLSTSQIADDSVTGPDIVNSTITPNKMNSAGASAGDVITYNGSNVAWGAPSGVTATSSPNWTGAHNWRTTASIDIDGANTIISSHPCRVVQSTTVANIAQNNGTNATLVAAVPGSTLTLTGVTSGNYARFCAQIPIDKSATGNVACNPMLDGVLQNIQGTAAANKAAWGGFVGNVNNIQEVGMCFTPRTAMSAGSHTVSVACAAIDGGGTWTMYNSISDTHNNWFTFQEVTCPD